MSKFSKFLRHIRHTAMAAAAAATYSSLSLAQRPTAQRLNKNKVFTIESFQGSRAYHHHMFWLSTTSNFCLFFFFKSCLAGYLSYKEIAFFHLSAAARAFGGNIFAHFCYHYTTVDAIALLTKCIFFFFFMCVCVDSGYFDFVDFQIIYFFLFFCWHTKIFATIFVAPGRSRTQKLFSHLCCWGAVLDERSAAASVSRRADVLSAIRPLLLDTNGLHCQKVYTARL